jgi:uncharacterized integral membrane protein (TIGR00698 family)
MTNPGRASIAPLVPGFFLAGGVALASWLVEPALKAATGGRVALPATVIALIIGIALYGLASRVAFTPGLTFCVKKLLRWVIALLGLRIALADIAGLGVTTIIIMVIAMVLTVTSGIWFARLVGKGDGLGALIGAACAVCGASATLATATVVPDYKEKTADIAFTVVMANAISTLVMLAYPLLCLWLGLPERLTGIMLGATIHDMAQVVGAGYAVSETAGNAAVIVKLFRVLLLLPVVLIIGWWLSGRGAKAGAETAKVPFPLFALGFLVLCLLNSVMMAWPGLSAALNYPWVKGILVALSNWGLLLCIAALGLGTSLQAILSIGWRHVAVFMGATLVILCAVTLPLLLMR